MSRSAQRIQELPRNGFLAGFRRLLSNFFLASGLSGTSVRMQSHQVPGMSTNPPRRRTLFSVPRDFVHRRRFRRRLTNLILIPLLSLLAAYVITRPTGGSGFTLPKPAQQASLSTRLDHGSELLTVATVSANSSSAGVLANPNATHPAASPVDPILGGAYMLDKGPHAVAEIPDATIHDAKHNKDLHLRIFYPHEPGPYPVIIFSAGEDASLSCCDALTRHWASYGYVTLQPTDGDSAQPRHAGAGEKSSALKAMREALGEPAVWQNGPLDISFVLDSLSALQNRIPALGGKIDAEHIGVGGHSMGAFTAEALAGALVDLPGRPAVSFLDRRVKAVLLLSPLGPGEFGLNSHSWEHVSLPFLSMTGSRDMGIERQSPEWREIPFERSLPGDKYQIFIQGADDTSFLASEIPLHGRAADGESILGYTNSASLSFWDAYLKADLKARMYLQSSALPDFSHGVVKLTRR